MKISLKLLPSFLLMTAPIVTFATPCKVFNSAGARQHMLADPLFSVLVESESCPESAIGLREVLQQAGLTLSPTMVANRGFHNPSAGSISIFETGAGSVSGRLVSDHEFFFGYFIGPDGTQLKVNDGRGLLVEALAWDPTKRLYNFYELKGFADGRRQWFYRGDSADIFADLKDLHLTNDTLGNTLRCSGCHMSGGPIMKEIASPHNDWWTAQNRLLFGNRQPSPSLANILADLKDPAHLAEATKAGIEVLNSSSFDQRIDGDWQQMLRPLFCSVEINLSSATHRLFDEPSVFSVPSDFFVDPWWSIDVEVRIESQDYYQALETKGSKFPENGFLDADHAWLTPVRSWQDTALIRNLVKQNLIDEEFVADVLAIDFTQPLFSKERCDLLKLLPKESHSWRLVFINRLRESSTASAQLLFKHLTDPAETKAAHFTKVRSYMEKCAESPNVPQLLDVLASRRDSVSTNVISTHPGGQILEPGFRVIFPKWRKGSGGIGLNKDCR